MMSPTIVAVVATIAPAPTVAIAIVPGIIAPAPTITKAEPWVIPVAVPATKAVPAPITASPAPAIGAEAPVPIIPVVRRGEYIGIKTVVVNVPVPDWPQTAAIDNIPVKRAADGNGVTRVAEADDAHGILVILGIAVEAIHPAIILLIDDERIYAVVERVAVNRTDTKCQIFNLGLLHIVALIIDVAAHTTAVVRIFVHRQRTIDFNRSRLAVVADAHSRHGHLLCRRLRSHSTCRSGSRCSLLLRDEVEVIVRLGADRAQHDRHHKTKE